jgi:hypothetical protein
LWLRATFDWIIAMNLSSNGNLLLLRALQNISTSLEVKMSPVPSRPNLGDFKSFVSFPSATIDATTVFFSSILLTRISFDELIFFSLERLYLTGTGISGTLPTELGLCTSLGTLLW